MANDPNVFWGDVLLCALACVPVLLFLFRKRINWKKRADVSDFDFGSGRSLSTPTVNVDGSAMCGGVDVKGNAYGVRSVSDHRYW